MPAQRSNPFSLTADQLELQDKVLELARPLAEDQHRWEVEGEFPWNRVKTLGEEGLLGLTLPKSNGGQGQGRLEAVLAIEQVARVSFILAEVVQIATNGPPFALSALADDSVCSEYLPDVITGDSLISIAITEREAGSSLGDTRTRADRRNGKVIVNGRKCFVTGGSLASAHLVMARFGGTGLHGLGYVLVPAHTEGCTVSKKYEKLGGNAIPEAELDFDGCQVPESHIVVGSDQHSLSGFRDAMSFYNTMRLGIAALCCGVTQRALDLIRTHLDKRKQFGQRLADFQGLRWRVARLAANLESARLLTYRAAQMTDNRGFPPARETALAKLAASEAAVQSADEAIQMLGWRGVVRDPDHPAERIFRQIRGWTIAGGTTEALLNLIARDELDI